MECPSSHGQVVGCLRGMKHAVTICPSNINSAVCEPGAVAAQAERKKIAKYSSLDSSYQFIPVAVEKCGSFGPKTHELVSELGHRVRRATLEENSHQYLVQTGFHLGISPWGGKLTNKPKILQFFTHHTFIYLPKPQDGRWSKIVLLQNDLFWGAFMSHFSHKVLNFVVTKGIQYWNEKKEL